MNLFFFKPVDFYLIWDRKKLSFLAPGTNIYYIVYLQTFLRGHHSQN